ncbi:hypothetical protein RYX36_010731 [Vicia faba]
MKTPTGTRSSPATGAEGGWSNEATFTLIDVWGKLYKKVNRKIFRQSHWKEVAKAVNSYHGYDRKMRRTYAQCKSRINALKKKYTIEKARVSDSNEYDNVWPFFEKLDSVIGDDLPPKNLSPPFDPPVKVPAWVLAPVGRRSSTQKQPVPVTTSSLERLDESSFCRNLAVFAAAAAAAAEAEIEDSNSDDSASDELELSNESKKRKRGRIDVEFGLREVASAAEKFSEIHERVDASKQRKNVALEKQKMHFSKDSQRMQLRKSNHSK